MRGMIIVHDGIVVCVEMGPVGFDVVGPMPMPVVLAVSVSVMGMSSAIAVNVSMTMLVMMLVSGGRSSALNVGIIGHCCKSMKHKAKIERRLSVEYMSSVECRIME